MPTPDKVDPNSCIFNCQPQATAGNRQSTGAATTAQPPRDISTTAPERPATTSPKTPPTTGAKPSGSQEVKTRDVDLNDPNIKRSPSLQTDLRELLQRQNWSIRYTNDGKGTRTDHAAKTIWVQEGTPRREIARTLAHETTHALRSLPSEFNEQMRNEGYAIMNEVRVNREIVANGGDDLGFTFSETQQWRELVEAAYNVANRGEVEWDYSADIIGRILADQANVSTCKNATTYRQYYSTGCQ